jgi:hypothetical protein
MTDAPELSRGKRIAFAVVAVLLLTVGPVLLMEGCASAYLFARDAAAARVPRTLLRPHTVHDSLLGWSNKPDYAKADEFGDGASLTIDARGFRAAPAPAGAAPAARTRIVCSGDSFTFGVGVGDDDVWCAQLGRELGAETVNLAVPAYGLDQSVLRYQRDGAPLAPRFHVLALSDAALERSTSGSDKGWSKPYLVAEDGTLRRRNVPVPPQEAGPLRRAAAWRAFGELRTVQLERRLRGISEGDDAAAAVDRRLPLFQLLLRDLVRSDSARGVALVVTYLPTVRGARRGEEAERRRRLAAIASGLGVPFVDLTPRMAALRPDSLDLAFFSATTPRAPQGVVGQYSPLGHRWIARTLALELQSLPVLAGAPAVQSPVPARPARSSKSH